MPTEPPKDLYNPDLIIQGTRATRERFASALLEVICYGTHWVHDVLSQNRDRVTDATLPCISLLYQMLEALDSALLLLHKACPIGMRLPLRTAFEALLSLEYILSEDTERRGRAYFVADIHRRLSLYRMYDPDTREGEQFKGRVARDKFAKDMASIRIEGLADARVRLEWALEKPSMKAVNEEYLRVQKETKQKVPKWYSLFQGPRNLHQLASKLNAPATYDILYREWSTTAHAQDMRRHMSVDADGVMSLTGLRDARELESAGQFALVFGVGAIRTFLHGVCPEVITSGRFESWYDTEVRAALIDRAL